MPHHRNVVPELPERRARATGTSFRLLVRDQLETSDLVISPNFSEIGDHNLQKESMAIEPEVTVVRGSDARGSSQQVVDQSAQLEPPQQAIAWLDSHAPRVAQLVRAHLVSLRRDLAASRSETRALRELVQRCDSATFH